MEFIGIVGAFSVLVTVGLHCTGIITCRKTISNGTVGQISHLPFISAAMMGGLWAAYGLLVFDVSIITVNTIGAILQSGYFIVHFFFSENKTHLWRDGGIATAFFVSVVLYFFVLNPEKSHPGMSSRDSRNAFTLGIVCNIFTILFFASPLVKMFEVIREKDTSSMSLPLSVMSMAVTLSWSFYGILIEDIFVQIPNMIGFVLSVAQLTLFVLYPSREGRSRSITPLPT